MRRVEADATWSLVRSARRCRTSPTSSARSSSAPTSEAEAQGMATQAGQGARSVRADDADAGPDRQRLDDLQGQVATARATRPRSAGERRPSLEPVHRDPRGHVGGRNRGLQPRLDQPRAVTRTTPERRRSTSTSSRETVRLAVRQLDRVIDLNFYPIETARRVEPALAAGRPGRDGPAGRVLPAAPALRLRRRRASCRRRSPRTIYFHALRRSCELAVEQGAHPSFAETRAARGELQFDAWGVVPDDAGALGRAARADQGARPAQLAADRHRADRDHRFDRRLLRVHRAAGLEPVQARDAVGRLPPGQPLPGRRAEAARACGRRDARRDQARGRLGAGHRRDSRRRCARSTARRGRSRCAR